MRHAPGAGLAALLAATAFFDGAAAEATAISALVPAGTLLTPSRLFGLAILAPTLLLAIGSLASLLLDLLRRNQDQ
jgi:hypothetical protein